MIEYLTPVKDHNSDPAYQDADIREQATLVFPLKGGGGGGLLAVKYDAKEFHISFVVFRFLSSETNDTNTLWSHVFNGSGPSGNLRELRHTYWGEVDNAGYIFYPDGDLIADAFNHLDRWFDRR